MVAGEQHGADRRVGGCQQQASGGWRAGRQARRQPAHELPGQAEGRDPRDERQAGGKRAVSQALLEVLGQREQQCVIGAGRGQQGQQRPADGRPREYLHVDQRRSAAGGNAALDG
jgi:hypothetical protein